MEIAGDDATFYSQTAVDAMFRMPDVDIDSVIIDCTTMGYVDYMGVDTLSIVSSQCVLSCLCVVCAMSDCVSALHHYGPCGPHGRRQSQYCETCLCVDVSMCAVFVIM